MPQVLPEFMEHEDITEAEPELLNDFRRRIVRPSHGPIEAIDQRIQPFGSNLIKASKIGHDMRAYLADCRFGRTRPVEGTGDRPLW